MRPSCDKSVTTSPQPQPPNMSPVTVAPCSPQIGKGPLNLCLNPIIDFEDLMPTDRLCDTNTTRHARFLGWWSFQLGEHWWQQAACWSPAFKSSQQYNIGAGQESEGRAACLWDSNKIQASQDQTLQHFWERGWVSCLPAESLAGKPQQHRQQTLQEHLSCGLRPDVAPNQQLSNQQHLQQLRSETVNRA